MSSIIKVDTIQLADGTAGTIENLGLATGALSHRNLIINGACQIAQRGTVTGMTNGSYHGGPDRFYPYINGAGTWSQSQAADAPDGFAYSCKLQCTATGTLTNYIGQRYIIESNDCVALNESDTFTVSFWVKSNKTGTYTCEPYDASSGGSQSVSKQFTINSADTWEKKTITYNKNPHDYPAGTGQALVLHWWLSAVSTWKDTEPTGDWQDFDSGFRAYGITNDFADSTSNYFSITGVQVEAGSVATPFEHRSYAEELARCQRYYIRRSATTTLDYPGDCHGWASTGGTQQFITRFDTVMRAAPSFSSSGNFRLQSGTHDSGWSSTISAANTSNIATRLVMSDATFSGTNNDAGVLQAQSAGNYIAFDAEM